MNQRSTALYLSMKGLSVIAIYQDFVQTLGAEAVDIAYPTVTWSFSAVRFQAPGQEAPDKAGVTGTDSVDADILKAFTDNPFSTVRELSRLTCLSRPTAHPHVTESPRLTVRHLH
jgi:hypothetical protein